jgi:hypothetical protein
VRSSDDALLREEVLEGPIFIGHPALRPFVLVACLENELRRPEICNTLLALLFLELRTWRFDTFTILARQGYALLAFTA